MGGKEKPIWAEVAETEKEVSVRLSAPPQLPVKVGNQKKDVNPKCEEKNYKIPGF